ncbi:craniofacial development protein 2-like [Zootermopsis nevadensis]|uniref:craniofacial development protein 2-like n=1 Tax=Zootermopsis nevadensis TaxID=136037 RepID=UPI000B8E6004|nr:craniofacial development protein 2-like [Zootermopsis nevadensis]
MKCTLVKYSGGKIVPQMDLRVGTAGDFALKKKKKNNCKKRIGTLNVRTLLPCRKLESLKLEMKRMRIDVLGVSEIRWRDVGDFWSGDYRVIHTGSIEGRPGTGGVGVVLSRELGQRVSEYVQLNGRIILVKLDTKPNKTVIVQVYMLTSNQEDDEVERVYKEINEIIRGVNGEDNLIIMGDWNAGGRRRNRWNSSGVLWTWKEERERGSDGGVLHSASISGV